MFWLREIWSDVMQEKARRQFQEIAGSLKDNLYRTEDKVRIVLKLVNPQLELICTH